MNADAQIYIPLSSYGHRTRKSRAQARGSQRSTYNTAGGEAPSAMRENNARADIASHSFDTEESQLFMGALGHLEARDIANVNKMLMRLTKIDQGRARNDAKLRDFLSQLYGLMIAPDLNISPKDLADIAFVLGKLQFNDPVVLNLLNRVGDIARYKVEAFTPHDMAGIVWGYTSLSVCNESLMSIVAAEVVNKIEGFEQRELSNTAWAYAKCGLWNDQLVTVITEACLKKLANFTAQSLSHTAWAMAQWEMRKDTLLDAIATEVQKKVNAFAPAPLAMIAWSFASLQLKNASLMSSISDAAGNKITNFKSSDLSHVAWAFATLRFQDHTLFSIISNSIQRNIRVTLPPDLANIAWAFSKVNLYDESLMGAIAKQAVPQIKTGCFKTSEISMLTWAFATIGLQDKQLMTEIGAQVAIRMDKFSATQLSHIAWAFGALQVKQSDFWHSLSAHVHGSISHYNSQGLSNIASAFATVTIRDENLLRQIAPEIASGTTDLRPLTLARCAWAYQRLAVQSKELMAALSAEALRKIQDFPTKSLIKLIDSVYVSLPTLEYPLLEKALAGRTDKVAIFLKSMWKSFESIQDADVQEYNVQLSNFGFIDCGIVGTPLILTQIGIDLPCCNFVQACRSQRWVKDAEERHDKGNQENLSHKSFTAAEFEITAMNQRLNDWVVRYQNNCLPDTNLANNACASNMRHEDTKTLLVAADTPGHNGRTEITYLVLIDLCARIFDLGVEPGSAESCASVTGSVQIFSTSLPSVSSVGAMQQFTVLFPNVVLEFTEQVNDTYIR